MLRQSDKLAFENLLRERALNGKTDMGIGTYSEKSVHHILKSFFERERDYHEVAYKGFVADILRDDKITEIQTATLSGLKDKLDAFLTDKCVRLVFPLYKKHRVIWLNKSTGEVEGMRASSHSRDMYTLLCELLYIVEYLRDPALTVTVVEMNVDDYRYLDGKGPYKKKRATKIDTVPTELISITDLVFPDDLYPLVSEKLSEKFTRDEFSKATHLKGRALWAALKVLLEMRVIEKTDSVGRKHVYSIPRR